MVRSRCIGASRKKDRNISNSEARTDANFTPLKLKQKGGLTKGDRHQEDLEPVPVFQQVNFPRPVAEGKQPRRGSATRRSRASAELIELTRQLMEKSIEFVPHIDFDRTDAMTTIQAMRPASLEERSPFRKSEPGLAFVTGLVDSPLLTPQEERYWFTWMNFLKFRAERFRRQLDLRHPDQSMADQIGLDLKAAEQARNFIVQANLRLIVALARKLATSLEQMTDLIGEGMAPMIRSVELFDIGMGYRFSTYATWAVRNQMIRWLKRERRIPEFVPGEDAPSLENLPDRQPATEASEVNHQIRLDIIHRLLSTLSERERQVVSARFALDGEPGGQSLAMIAERVGLSKERVRQIALNALAKLRGSMTCEELEAMS